MQDTRLKKIERLVQKDLGEVFLLQTKSKLQGVIVSVTNVVVSADLSLAKAYLSIFPSEKAKDILESINLNKKNIRFEMGNRERNQLRKIPEFTFFIDDSLDYLEKIDNLLNKSKQ